MADHDARDPQGVGPTGRSGTTGSGDDPRDLLAVYALDAVDDLERRTVERLVAADPDARRELDELREVVAAFTADEAPPAALRDAVLGRVASTPQAERAADGTVRRPGSVPLVGRSARPVRRRWVTLAVAAAVVAAVAVPTTVAVQARTEQRQLQAEADTIAAMLADPASRTLRAPMEGGGDVTALLSGDKVLLTASGMATPAAGTDYQLWLVEGDSITSAGLLRPEDGSVRTLLDAPAGTTLAVTLEPAGGSAQPTSEPLVAVET